MPFNIGAPELLIVLVVVLIVFGAGRLPAVMGDLGRGVREFKRAQDAPPDAPITSTTPQGATTPLPVPGTNGPASGTGVPTASAPARDVERARA